MKGNSQRNLLTSLTTLTVAYLGATGTFLANHGHPGPAALAAAFLAGALGYIMGRVLPLPQ